MKSKWAAALDYKGQSMLVGVMARSDNAPVPRLVFILNRSASGLMAASPSPKKKLITTYLFPRSIGCTSWNNEPGKITALYLSSGNTVGLYSGHCIPPMAVRVDGISMSAECATVLAVVKAYLIGLTMSDPVIKHFFNLGEYRLD